MLEGFDPSRSKRPYYPTDDDPAAEAFVLGLPTMVMPDEPSIRQRVGERMRDFNFFSDREVALLGTLAGQELSGLELAYLLMHEIMPLDLPDEELDPLLEDILSKYEVTLSDQHEILYDLRRLPEMEEQVTEMARQRSVNCIREARIVLESLVADPLVALDGLNYLDSLYEVNQGKVDET